MHLTYHQMLSPFSLMDYFLRGPVRGAVDGFNFLCVNVGTFGVGLPNLLAGRDLIVVLEVGAGCIKSFPSTFS